MLPRKRLLLYTCLIPISVIVIRIMCKVVYNTRSSEYTYMIRNLNRQKQILISKLFFYYSNIINPLLFAMNELNYFNINILIGYPQKALIVFRCGRLIAINLNHTLQFHSQFCLMECVHCKK